MDRDKADRLTAGLLVLIKDHYETGPLNRDRVYECLNALAAATAYVISGCDGPLGGAHGFFNEAFRVNLGSMWEREQSARSKSN